MMVVMEDGLREADEAVGDDNEERDGDGEGEGGVGMGSRASIESGRSNRAIQNLILTCTPSEVRSQ